MAAWEIVSAAAAISFAAISVWLFCGQKITLNSFSLEMPYVAVLIFGILFVSLAVLAVAEMIYFSDLSDSSPWRISVFAVISKPKLRETPFFLRFLFIRDFR